MIHHTFIGLLMLGLLLPSCNGQTTQNEDKLVGGPCEDCEAALDYRLINPTPKSVDSLPGYADHHPKLKISGTVYQSDGKTPAEDVILYLYHTNRQGIYEPSENPIGWERRHGKHRGWVKTNAQGEYAFYTFRPSPYPQGQEPEHIHIYVKEPNKIPYYLDSYIFLDDPTLKEEEINSQKNRGGSGLIQFTKEDGILVGKRDLMLGLNIPDYDD
ncbi:MAG: intradiol ring-cleavage dioxygenase [Bacteroidota bacterium]